MHALAQGGMHCPGHIAIMNDLLYCDARLLIHDGDFVLFPPSSVIGRLIANGKRYSHAGMVYWDQIAGKKRLILAHTLQFSGGETAFFSGQVKRYGPLSIFRPPESYNTEAAVDEMLTIIGQKYGWRAFFRAAAQHTLVIKRWFPSLSDEEVRRRGLWGMCSQEVSAAAVAGGFDPSDKPNSITEPNDLTEKTTHICDVFWDRLPKEKRQCAHF